MQTEEVEPGSVSDAPQSSLMSVRRPSDRVVLGFLVGITMALVVGDMVSRALGDDIGERLSLDAEASLPAWWASTQLLILAVTLAIVALRASQEGERDVARAVNVFSLAAIYFSIDEAVAIHEGITKMFVRLGWGTPFAGDHGVWIIVYAVVGVIVMIYAGRGAMRLLRLDRANSLLLLAGGLLFVLGGVGIEIIGYFEPSRSVVTLEEALEFLGIGVAVWASYRMLEGTTILAPSSLGNGAVPDTTA